VTERGWRSPAGWDWVPVASAPVITLAVVMGGLAAWVGVTLMTAPGSAPSRTAALALLGIGCARLVSAPSRDPAVPAGEVMLLAAVAGGPESLQRLSGLAAAVGLAAGAGLLPLVAESGAGDRRSVLTWTAVFGPVIAFTALYRLQALLPPAAATAFGATLVGLGIANAAWGL